MPTKNACASSLGRYFNGLLLPVGRFTRSWCRGDAVMWLLVFGLTALVILLPSLADWLWPADLVPLFIDKDDALAMPLLARCFASRLVAAQALQPGRRGPAGGCRCGVAGASGAGRAAGHGMSARAARVMRRTGVACLLALGGLPRHPGLRLGIPTPLTVRLPDYTPKDERLVQAWQESAAEAGFALQKLGAARLICQARAPRERVLNPLDGLHQRMNDALVAQLRLLMHGGAGLMLVPDAGGAMMDWRDPPRQSRLSTQAGIGDPLYDARRAERVGEQVVGIDAGALPLLQLPPGKLLREGSEHALTSAGGALKIISPGHSRPAICCGCSGWPSLPPGPPSA